LIATSGHVAEVTPGHDQPMRQASADGIRRQGGIANAAAMGVLDTCPQA